MSNFKYELVGNRLLQDMSGFIVNIIGAHGLEIVKYLHNGGDFPS